MPIKLRAENVTYSPIYTYFIASSEKVSNSQPEKIFIRIRMKMKSNIESPRQLFL